MQFSNCQTSRMNAFWKLYHRDLSRCLIGAVLIISAGCNGGLSAFKETRKAAEMGYTNAQFNLSNMYRVGEGVPKNDKKAVTWYRKAAEQGNATAQHNLGWMYYKGEGVPENDAEAVTWYRKAAYQGNAIAQGNLTIRISEAQQVSQPGPFAEVGTTKTTERTDVGVDQGADNRLAVVNEGITLQEMVNGLNALGIGPRDMITILQAIKAAGAMQASIEVM